MEQSYPKATIDFTDYISKHTESFTGREWVFAEIEAWLATPNDARCFIITGEPGIGKTAIAVQFAQMYNVAATHFCIGRQAETIDPLNFARSLSQQLTRIEGFAQCILNDQGVHLSAQASSNQNYGTLVGMKIDTLVVQAPSATVAFNRVVADPLRRFYSDVFDQQLIILVNALDEAVQHLGPETIVDLLANAQGLPPQVRFVLTSRPEGEVMRHFEQLKSQTLLLNAASEENLRDTQNYVRRQLDASTYLQERLAEHEMQPETLVNHLVTASQGNFLYLVFLLPALADGIQRLDALDALPKGLYEAYRNLLRQRTIGKNIHAWRTLYRPVLGVVAAAQVSLTIKQLAQFTGLGEQVVDDVLLDAQQFFDPTQMSRGQYRFYHQSIAEFLRVKEQAQELWIDLKPAHEGIVNYYRGRASTWEDVNWSRIDDYGLLHLATHLYTLRDAVSYRQDLFGLICKAFMREKYARYGSHRSFAEDVLVAIRVAGNEETLDLVQEIRGSLVYATLGSLSTNIPPLALSVLVQCGQSARAQDYAALIHDPENRSSAFQLIGEALLAQQKVQEARQVLIQAILAAGMIDHTGQRFRALRAVAEILGRAEGAEEAMAGVRQAMSVAKETGSIFEERLMLRDVAQTLARIGQVDEAMKIVEEIRDEWIQAIALGEVALALAQRKERAQAVAIVKRMLDLAEQIDDRWFAATVLSRVARALAEARELPWMRTVVDRALALLVETENGQNKAEALVELAQTLAQEGEKESVITTAKRAVTAAKEIGYGGGVRARVQGTAARALVRVGENKRALSIAKQMLSKAEAIKDDRNKVSTLCIAAQILQSIGEEKDALTVATRAVEVGREMNEQYSSLKIGAIREATETLAHIGQFDQAIVTAEMIRNVEIKAGALSLVAQVLIESGDKERALAMANRAVAIATAIERTAIKAATLTRMAQALTSTGYNARATTVAKQAVVEAAAIEKEHVRVFQLGEVARILAQINLIDQAMEAAEAISGEWSESKARALRNVAQALHQGGKQEQAVVLANKSLAMSELEERQPDKSGQQGEVSLAFASLGLYDRALAVAEKIQITAVRVDILREIAQILKQAGKKEQAMVTIQRSIAIVDEIEDLRNRVEELLKIARGLAQMGEQEYAGTVVHRALDVTREITWYHRHQADPLCKVAQALAEIGQFDEAISVAAEIKIDDKGIRYEALRAIALTLTREGKPTRAVSTLCRWLAEAIQEVGEAETPATVVRLTELAEFAHMLAQGGKQVYARSVLEEALRMAEEIWLPKYKAVALGKIASALVWAEERERIVNVATQALALSKSMEDIDSRNRQLESIIGVLTPLGEQKLAVVAVNESLQVVNAIKERYVKANKLAGIARLLMLVGEQKRAMTVATRVLTLARGIKNALERAEVLCHVTGILAQGGRMMEAGTVIEQLMGVVDATSEYWEKEVVQYWTAMALIHLEQFDRALAISEETRRASAKINGFIDVASTLIKVKREEEALRVVARAEKVMGQIEDEYHLAFKLIDVAQIVSQAGQTSRAVELASAISNRFQRAIAFSKIAQTLVEKGDWTFAVALVDRALELANSLESSWDDTVAILRWVAPVLAQTGEKERAIAIACQILAQGLKDEDEIVEAMSDLARVFIEAGEHTLAVAIATRAIFIARRIKGTHARKVSALEKVSRILIQANQLNQAEKIVALIEGGGYEVEALNLIAQAHMQIGHQQQALSVLRNALEKARTAGRMSVYDVLGSGVSILASIDLSQTLEDICVAIEEIDSWWEAT